MKRIKCLTIFSIILLLMTSRVFASDLMNHISKMEYSKEYLEWLELSDEQKANSIMPRMYNVYRNETKTNNIIKYAKTYADTLQPKFSLKDIIPENMVIKNQKSLGACWAFAALGSLESNLAMYNYKNEKTVKVYDFSERHMEYATSQSFLNNAKNEYGFNRKVGRGGNYSKALAYLTNGIGPVNESDMKYSDFDFDAIAEEKNNIAEDIYISEIQNKTVTGEVYDTVEFPTTSTMNKENLKQIMKEHIKKYGGIDVAIHEEDKEEGCLNEKTGASYCKDKEKHIANHDVLIVGWDDTYGVENFNEGAKPTNNGAWIVKDSHGDNEEWAISFDEFKQELFEKMEEQFKEKGIYSASEIPDEMITQLLEKAEGITVDETKRKIYELHNDDGYLYVSYEDVNIYSQMMGITKSSDEVVYDNIYQYNLTGANGYLTANTKKAYIANVFERKDEANEYITKIGINIINTSKCRVYINPKNDSKNIRDISLIQLQEGESKILEAGYHVLSLNEPIKIEGEKFVVCVEIESNDAMVSLESNENIKIQEEKCFVAYVDNELSDNNWNDMSKEIIRCNSTIKAFTVSSVEDDSLKNIQITTKPNKTTYFVGENFDKTGMVVKANYNNGESIELDDDDYEITNGNNLQKNQTSVTIFYEDKTVEQPITVNENSVTNLEIITPPTKVEYKAGENFDPTGMVVRADFEDGTSKEVSDYKILDGTNLKNGQTEVTVQYGDETVTQEITVIENNVVELEIVTPPTKTEYIVGQNFDKTGMVVKAIYEDESEVEIEDYTIENGTNLTIDQTYVTIEFEDKTVNQAITVSEKSVTKIEVSSRPSKVQYIQNKESLDLTGGKIKVNYNDGASEEVSMNNEQVKITGFNNKNVGKVTVTVSYFTKTATFEVDIIEEPKQEEQQPENSDFSKTVASFKSLKYYTYSDKSKKEYGVLDIEIDGVDISDKNDSAEYYYYISKNQKENTITGWIKITKSFDSDGKILLRINTKDLENFSEISESDNLYIYLKEVAVKGGNQKVFITDGIKIDNKEKADIEIYADDKLYDEKEWGKDEEDDDTVKPGILPETGEKILVGIAIIGVLAIAGYSILRVKKFDF